MFKLKTFGMLLGGWILLAGLAQAATTDYFIIKVKTDNPGTSAANEFTIPTNGSGYNYSVDLDSDGTWEYTGIAGNTTCVFAAPGTYTISIGGGAFPRIYFSDTGDRQKLISIDQWGTNPWTSMDWAFSGCSNLTITAVDAPDLSNVTSAWYMFSGARSMNQPIGHWDVSHITDMTGMFSGALIFNQDLSGWNTGNVTYMMQMFMGAWTFNQDISGWNTANVTDMSYMFWQTRAFNQPIQSWNTSNVTQMAGMFGFTTEFNQNLSNWDTSSVVDMSQMFMNATGFNQSLANWNTANVKTMRGMFRGATLFNQPISAWNTGKVEDMHEMFRGATLFNQSIGAWNTGKVADMSGMFRSAAAFNRDIGSWNTVAVNSMTAMFSGAVSFDQDLGAWNITSLLEASEMFAGVQLSMANYEALLNGWGVQNVQSNVVFDGGGSQYASFASVTRRNGLIVNKNWTITDGGWYATPTVTPSITLTPTATASSTPSPAATATASSTPSPAATATVSPTPSPIQTATAANPLSAVDLTGKLFFAYPNPARDQLKFLMDPDRPVRVRIEIVNLNGEPVGAVKESLPAGRGIVTWDCRGVVPGIYIARIFMDNQEIGKAKLAVVR